MPTTVAVLNMKGGVGKTTVTRNLAYYAAYARDLWVLGVDLDPQFNLTQYMLGEKAFRQNIIEKQRPTVMDIFEVDRPRIGPSAPKKDGSINPIVNIYDWGDRGGIDLIPSRLEFAWTLRNPTEKERHLRNFLGRQGKKYDLILLDCPPTESMATSAAYLASDYILVPVKPEYLATIGLPLLAASLANFHGKYDDQKVEVAGILFNDFEDSWENQRAKDDVRTLAAEHGWHVFKNEISHSQSYPRGARLQKSILQTDYAREEKKREMVRFGREFLERVGLVATVPST